jgi:predicted DNA-binding transcriptional regulator AlpA
MTLKRAIEAGDFPPAIHLGKNSLAWKAIDVQRWLDQRQSANRKSA